MKKAIIVSGPTASGKTALVFDIVRNINAAVINADSRQVYKSIDIIVGKDIPEDSDFISCPEGKYDIGYFTIPYSRLYLSAVLTSVTEEFSVADYLYLVEKVLSDLDTSIIPIFVGGSNFYISALSNPPQTLSVPQNVSLRMKLSKYSVTQLQDLLKKEDKNKISRMNDSDRNNPRRLIRAIEVAKWKNTLNGKKSGNLQQSAVLAGYEIFNIGLVAPLDQLRRKIDARVDARITQGAIEEAKEVFAQYENVSNTIKMTNGFRELFEYFQNEVSYKEAIQKWKYAEYHNAKKQLTWMNADSSVKKYSIVQPHFEEIILQDILDFLQK